MPDDGAVGTLDLVSIIVVGYGALVTLVSAYAVWRWRARPPWLSQLAWMLELLCAVRAIGGLGSILAGDRPAELGAHVGYLVSSVCIIPLALRSVDRDGVDEGAWAVGVIAVAALAVTVIGVRLMMTL